MSQKNWGGGARPLLAPHFHVGGGAWPPWPPGCAPLATATAVLFVATAEHLLHPRAGLDNFEKRRASTVSTHIIFGWLENPYSHFISCNVEKRPGSVAPLRHEAIQVLYMSSKSRLGRTLRAARMALYRAERMGIGRGITSSAKSGGGAHELQIFPKRGYKATFWRFYNTLW